ncbi:MAG: DUF2812 domain-containing protein [Propionibacteriaceae bacterium]|jgi:hypothetical protein|nr:DUF2812 domain-containing protein [Propionibacteriaceae bacterium]
MAKYRLCGGLAMMPRRDMALLKDMGLKGWHVTHLKGMFYRFEAGTPHDYDFALNLERHTTDDMKSLFKASGWTPVISRDGYQIYRAEAGTSPIFSDAESEIEVLESNRRWTGKWALVFGCLVAAVIALVLLVPLNVFLEIALLCVSWLCFVFTLLPFIGFTLSIRKKHA